MHETLRRIRKADYLFLTALSIFHKKKLCLHSFLFTRCKDLSLEQLQEYFSSFRETKSTFIRHVGGLVRLIRLSPIASESNEHKYCCLLKSQWRTSSSTSTLDRYMINLGLLEIASPPTSPRRQQWRMGLCVPDFVASVIHNKSSREHNVWPTCQELVVWHFWERGKQLEKQTRLSRLSSKASASRPLNPP